MWGLRLWETSGQTISLAGTDSLSVVIYCSKSLFNLLGTDIESSSVRFSAAASMTRETLALCLYPYFFLSLCATLVIGLSPFCLCACLFVYLSVTLMLFR